MLELGNTFVTRGINDLMEDNIIQPDDIVKILDRHEKGDFGEICEEDKELNQAAYDNGNDRVLSIYRVRA